MYDVKCTYQDVGLCWAAFFPPPSAGIHQGTSLENSCNYRAWFLQGCFLTPATHKALSFLDKTSWLPVTPHLSVNLCGKCQILCLSLVTNVSSFLKINSVLTIYQIYGLPRIISYEQTRCLLYHSTTTGKNTSTSSLTCVTTPYDLSAPAVLQHPFLVLQSSVNISCQLHSRSNLPLPTLLSTDFSLAVSLSFLL